MTSEAELLHDTTDELFEEAPCGYLSTRLDGTILRVNRTFEEWTGRGREELIELVRFQELLSIGGRIYYETHYAPLLHMQGAVREVAVEVVRADGSLLPALVNSVLKCDSAGQPRMIRTTVFAATDRRRYEEELLRARRQEHEIARELQESLLVWSPPASPAVTVEVEYSAGVRGTQVGGDWYDAFWLVDGRVLGLVIGDVVGRGIGAAATMGQLRSAVRAFATTGLEPAALLSALDAYCRRYDVGLMTTLVYARLDVASGALLFACAGHPPPLVVSRGEPPEFDWEGRSTPLAVLSRTPRRQASRAMKPGSRLLVYTDGLIERRSHTLYDGLARLRSQVQAEGDRPLGDLVRSLVRELRDPVQSDDVCMLALDYHPQTTPEPSERGT